MIKDQSTFSLVIILLILVTLSLDNVWTSLGENCCWSLLVLKGLTKVPNEFLGWFIAGNSFILHFQFQADSSSTLPYPLKAPLAPELESDGSDGVDSAGIFVHESTQVRYLCF